MIELTINGKQQRLDADPEMPLLWAIRDLVGLTGTKFGCGAALCGACTVHIDGEANYACLNPISTMQGRSVTTIEGLSPRGDHPLQRAWVAEQVPQCGYWQSGQIMRAATLLRDRRRPTREEIVNPMQPVICRCGTYARIVRAIERAAQEG